MPAPLPPRERILKRCTVDPITNCWEWDKPASLGYGRIGVNYRKKLAHRVSYEDFVGPIPDGMTVDHLCMNKRCVNPSHLEAVTQAENVRRAASVGLLDRKSHETHCKHGHEYTPENTRITKRGHRDCVLCNRIKRRKQRAAARKMENCIV